MRRRFGPKPLALVWLLWAGCESITRDELRCEAAMSHLVRCCSGLSGSPVECVGTGSLPFIEFPNVQCLLDFSCSELESRGVCEWAHDPNGQVCP